MTCMGTYSYADEVYIENHVSAEAESGGSSASGSDAHSGTVTTGSASASVDVTTDVDGVNQSVSIVASTTNGHAVVEKTIATSSGGTQIQTNARASASSTPADAARMSELSKKQSTNTPSFVTRGEAVKEKQWILPKPISPIDHIKAFLTFLKHVLGF